MITPAEGLAFLISAIIEILFWDIFDSIVSLKLIYLGMLSGLRSFIDSIGCFFFLE